MRPQDAATEDEILICMTTEDMTGKNNCSRHRRAPAMPELRKLPVGVAAGKKELIVGKQEVEGGKYVSDVQERTSSEIGRHFYRIR